MSGSSRRENARRQYGRRENPYVGPRALDEGEPIFGRAREERQLFQLLVARRIALLHAPSGAGKTSLVQAGLVPRLMADGFHVLPIGRLNKRPSGAARDAVNRYHYSLLLSLEGKPEAQPDETLLQLSLAEYLAPHFGSEEEPQLPVLIVDQFEELLNVDPADSEARQAFFVELGQALRDPRLWALFVIREDYLGALEPFTRAIPTRLSNTFRLDLLDQDAAGDAICEPARSRGVVFDEAAVETLVDDLRRIQVQQADGSFEEQRGPYVEPVQLQVICHRLWQKLPPQKTTVSVEDVQKIGDVDQSLAAYYADCIAQTADDVQIDVSERYLRQWVQDKLITRDGVRLPVLMGQETTEGLDNRAVRRLQDAHLLRADRRGGITWFELAHDRLVGPIRKDNATWFSRHLSPLQRQSQRWVQEDRPDYLLLSAEQLDEAAAWAQAHEEELSGADRAFLAACLKERERQEELRAAQIRQRDLEHQRALAQEQRKRADLAEATSVKLRQRRNLAFALAAGSLLLAMIALFLFRESNRNAAERAAAEATALASEATALAALVAANADGAVAYSQQATAQSALATNEAILVDLLATEEARALEAAQDITPEEAEATAATPTPELTETTGTSETTPSPTTSEPVAVGTLAIRAEPVEYLAIQLETIRDQQTVVAAARVMPTPVNTSIVFDSIRDGNTNLYVMNEDGSNLRRLTSSANYQGEADISPDGRWIAYEERQGTRFFIYTMPLAGGEPLRLVQGRQPDWSPDGRAIAYESTTSPNQLWSIPVADGAAAGEPVRLTGVTGDGARAPSWSPDGTRIVFMTEVDDHWQLAILDVEDSRYRVITFGETHRRFPVWSPDGELIAFNTLTADGEPDQIWAVEPSGEDMRPLTTEGSNGRPAWSPDGRFLVFNSNRDGPWLLYKMDRNGANQAALTSQGPDQRANWGP